MKIIELDEIIEWIQAHQRNEATVTPPVPPPVPPPTPPPSPPQPPVGPGTGTETDPYTLTFPLSEILGYGFDKHYNGQKTVPNGGNLWFRTDPALISGLVIPTRLWLNVLNYDAYEQNISVQVFSVNQSTGARVLVRSVTPGANAQYAIRPLPYNVGIYYLIRVYEMGTPGSDQNVSIYWRPY